MSNGEDEKINEEIKQLETRLSERIDLYDKKLGDISDGLKEVNKKLETGQKPKKSEDEDPVAKKTKTLAIISKRLEEVKEKIETGQLKAKESELIGLEHKVLRENYEDLVKELFQESIKKS